MFTTINSNIFGDMESFQWKKRIKLQYTLSVFSRKLLSRKITSKNRKTRIVILSSVNRNFLEAFFKYSIKAAYSLLNSLLKNLNFLIFFIKFRQEISSHSGNPHADPLKIRITISPKLTINIVSEVQVVAVLKTVSSCSNKKEISSIFGFPFLIECFRLRSKY